MSLFKILIITDAWYPQTNGVVRTMDNLGQQLRKRGHEVKYITPKEFFTVPMPTYPEIRLALNAWPKINKMIKLLFNLLFISTLMTVHSFATDDFQQWVKKFERKAIQTGVSEKVVKDIMSEARFLPKVIEYDRYQPEFYEDTFTYIKKRTFTCFNGH